MIKQKKTILKLIPLIFLALAILIIPSVSSVTMQIDSNYTASQNNATISIDTIPIFVDKLTITNTSVELINSSWTNGNLIVNTTGLINWTSGVIYSSQFPYLTQDTNTAKTITSPLSLVNPSITFNVQDCASSGTISYRSNAGTTATFYKGSYVCQNNQATTTLPIIDVGSNNALTIVYGCVNGEKGVMTLVEIFSALAIVVFGISLFYLKKEERINVDTWKLVLVFIAISIGMAFIVQIANNIVSYCGV